MTDVLKQQIASQKLNSDTAEMWNENIKSFEEEHKRTAEFLNTFSTRTEPIKKAGSALDFIEEMAQFTKEKHPNEKPNSHFDYAAISLSANKVLDDLVKHGLSVDERIAIKKGKKPTVDLDGSQKTFFGKIKNKIRNFWKPNNPKKYMEDEIANLKIALAKDPDLFTYVGDFSVGSKSFKDINQIRIEQDRYSSNNLNAISRDIAQRKEYSQHASEEAQNAQNNVDAIRIELKAQARENLGITNNEQQIDALAARADAMKNMSPEQRLAFRLSQLRGTAKKQPKARVVPMNQQQNNQTMVIKKMNEGRA